MSYNPKPTRVWSRVQHPCTFTLDSSYNSVFSPLTGKTTSLLEADYYNKLLYKGNILQYKKNTSNLTKSQKYSQICKGMWTNRTKSYATQTQTYTNPNTSNLKQVNFINVPTNGVTTYIPGPYNFNIPAPNGCPSDVIKEGGSLLCNTIVNPCTDEEIDVTKVLECYPTSCSDVPGPIIDLCWNPKLDTWYPRQNLTMPTSGTKWPEGYKGLVSALSPDVGVLSLLSFTVDTFTATLSWTLVNNVCIPISSYNIYENGQLIANVPYPTNSYTYTNCDTNTFYITSISGTTESEPSNTVTITSPPLQLNPPVLSLDSFINNTATFSWTFVNNDCIPISSFNIYENGVFIENIPYPTNSATYTVCGGNTFYVTSVSGTTESGSSNEIVIELPFTTTGGPLSYTVDSNCNYIVTFTGSGTIIFNNTNLVNYTVTGGGGNGGNGPSGGGANAAGGGGGGGGGGTNISSFVPTISTSYTITVGTSTSASSISTIIPIATIISSPPGLNGSNGSSSTGFGGAGGAGGNPADIYGTNGSPGQNQQGSQGGAGGVGGAGYNGYGNGGSGGYGGAPNLEPGQNGFPGGSGVVILSFAG
jgi:hypothetical protein